MANEHNLTESLAAIVICMAVASMCFTIAYVYFRSKDPFMISTLAMLIISAIVRVIERFNFNSALFDPSASYYGIVVGSEISITWGCLLLSEWLIAMKYFDLSSQMPAILTGHKPIQSINPGANLKGKVLGAIANILVSIWPGILYSQTYYSRDKAGDMTSIFWEFEISIWLNALCRFVSLGFLCVAMCRISDCVNRTRGLNTDGSMVCLNWTLLILTASVQVSLVIFYSLGLIYHDNKIFQNYTTVMMYVNVACTCGSQVILSFIYALMSDNIEITQQVSKFDGSLETHITREGMDLLTINSMKPLMQPGKSILVSDDPKMASQTPNGGPPSEVHSQTTVTEYVRLSDKRINESESERSQSQSPAQMGFDVSKEKDGGLSSAQKRMFAMILAFAQVEGVTY